MNITEIQPGTTITIVARTPLNQIEFQTTVEDIIPEKNTVLAQVIMKDNKLITFKGNTVITDVLVPFENANPQLFKNVEIGLVRKADNSIWYTIRTIAGSKVFNRRESFRCSVGVSTTVQILSTHTSADAIIKDVSNTGFGFICSEDVQVERDQLVHAVMYDVIEKLGEKFSFQLTGHVVNVIPLENGRIQVGCRFNKDIPGIDKYIVTKERMRLKNTHGTR